METLGSGPFSAQLSISRSGGVVLGGTMVTRVSPAAVRRAMSASRSASSRARRSSTDGASSMGSGTMARTVAIDWTGCASAGRLR